MPTLAEVRAELRRRDLGAYVEHTTGFLLEPWQRILCDRLSLLKDQQGQRLLIHGPPQFGKSIIISQRLPAWILGNRPDYRIRLACYNETHATRFSKVNLELMRAPEFLEAFPDSGCRLPRICQEAEWSTAARAAKRDAQPSFRALGLRSGFVGLGGDLVAIDDPYKDRSEAFSETIGEGIWLWWTEVVMPRLNPLANVVVMFHRWKDDDLAGRLLGQGGWEYLRFPAIADGEPGDPTGREKDEPLSPRYSIDFLRNVETNQGKSTFASLYQGLPRPDGGALFKSDWFHDFEIDGDFYRLRRGDSVRTVLRRDCWIFQTDDFASSEKTAADWTVVSTWAVTPQRDLLLLDVRRERHEGPEAKEMVRSAFRRYDPSFAVVETNGVGMPMAQDLISEGLPIRGVFQHKDKYSRATGAAVRYEAGGIYHLKDAPWRDEWEKELLLFPNGKHDDQVDCASLAARVITVQNSILSDFAEPLHVALDALPYDPDRPVVLGWAFEPVPAAVVMQLTADGDLFVFWGATAPAGAVYELGERTADWLQRELGDLAGIPLSEMALRHFGPAEWLGEREGGENVAPILHQGTKRAVGHDATGHAIYDQRGGFGFLLAPSRASRTQRDEAIRDRLKLLQHGRPGFRVDPGAREVIEALNGGYRYRQQPHTGLPANEPEKNPAMALAEALGHGVLHLFAAKPRNESSSGGGRVPVRAAGRRREM